jgi:hypothetical protein
MLHNISAIQRVPVNSKWFFSIDLGDSTASSLREKGIEGNFEKKPRLMDKGLQHARSRKMKILSRQDSVNGTLLPPHSRL